MLCASNLSSYRLHPPTALIAHRSLAALQGNKEKMTVSVATTDSSFVLCGNLSSLVTLFGGCCGHVNRGKYIAEVSILPPDWRFVSKGFSHYLSLTYYGHCDVHGC